MSALFDSSSLVGNFLVLPVFPLTTASRYDFVASFIRSSSLGGTAVVLLRRTKSQHSACDSGDVIPICTSVANNQIMEGHDMMRWILDVRSTFQLVKSGVKVGDKMMKVFSMTRIPRLMQC